MVRPPPLPPSARWLGDLTSSSPPPPLPVLYPVTRWERGLTRNPSHISPGSGRQEACSTPPLSQVGRGPTIPIHPTEGVVEGLTRKESPPPPAKSSLAWWASPEWSLWNRFGRPWSVLPRNVNGRLPCLHCKNSLVMGWGGLSNK